MTAGRRAPTALALVVATSALGGACAPARTGAAAPHVGTPTSTAVQPAPEHERELAPWRALWDFADPAASEARLRAAAAEAAAAGDRGLELELGTQVARALGLAGRFDAALAELDAVAAALGGGGAAADVAGAIPSRTRVARVEVLLALERGRVLRSRGDRAASIAPFERAFERAGAAGLDYLAVDAAHMLGIAAEGPVASAWNARALDLAGASADPSARGWAAVLANNEGWNRFEAGDHAAALALFERALELRRERPQDVEPLWIARWCVARAHRALGRVDEALAEQRALLAEREGASSPDGFVHEELAECLLALGRADEARPHFARAHALLSELGWLVESEPERLARLERLGR